MLKARLAAATFLKVRWCLTTSHRRALPEKDCDHAKIHATEVGLGEENPKKKFQDHGDTLPRHLAHVFVEGQQYKTFIVAVCSAHNAGQHGQMEVRENADMVELEECNCWRSGTFSDLFSNRFY